MNVFKHLRKLIELDLGIPLVFYKHLNFCYLNKSVETTDGIDKNSIADTIVINNKRNVNAQECGRGLSLGTACLLSNAPACVAGGPYTHIHMSVECIAQRREAIYIYI